MKSSVDASAPIMRRNTISTLSIPSKLEIPSNPRVASFPIARGEGSKACFPGLDFELISLNSLAYTSLKDILPPSVLDQGLRSPATSCTASGCETSVRKHFVKQAATAYFQPTSNSPDSSGGYSFRRLLIGFSTKFLVNPVKACVSFFNRQVLPTISQFSDRLLGVIWIGRRDKKD